MDTTGLMERIRRGKPRPVRDYHAEVETSLDKAAMSTARVALDKALRTIEPAQMLEHVRDAQTALVTR